MFRPFSVRLASSLSPLIRHYTSGKPLYCKAAVAHKAAQDLKIEMIEVAPPKPKEVRIKMIATAICQ